jgi:lipopolysaccharide transport system ATP-binding protein
VLAVGDAAFQKKCIGKMNEVAEGGKTILFVSHQLGSVQKLCSECLLLDRGTIKLRDETDKVIENNIKDIVSTNKHVDRKGNGKIEFQNYYIGNKESKKQDQFLMGDTLYIFFVLNYHENVRDTEISIEIKDIFNNSIANIDTRYNVV